MKQIVVFLLSMQLLSCAPSAEEMAAERLQMRYKLKQEKILDSLQIMYREMGYTWDEAMMKTHGETAHRGECEIYKKWKKELDGR